MQVEGLINNRLGIHPELDPVLISAQKLALRLGHERVQDVHLLWSLLGSSAVKPEDNEFAVAGIRRNTVFLAIETVLGRGNKKDNRAATFTDEARNLYDSSIEKAAEDGRKAEPRDMLKNLLEQPSLATKMVLDVIARDHLQRNGAPNIAKARAETWEYKLGVQKVSIIKHEPQTRLSGRDEAFLMRVSMRIA